MNPDAKEFVPAHIMRKRQDEADLAKQLDQVGLSNGETSSREVTNTDNPDDKQTNESKNVQDNSRNHESSSIEKKDGQHDKDEHNTHSNGLENYIGTNHHHKSEERQHNNINNNHNNNTNNHDLANHDDDSHLLNAGENFCEFNGEQFIIPASDDEYEDEQCPRDLPRAGYDFGNNEDNDNEDVCNAYQQFLDSLPDE